MSGKTARNIFTGDYLRTKPPTDTYREQYDKIDWSNKTKVTEVNSVIEEGDSDEEGLPKRVRRNHDV